MAIFGDDLSGFLAKCKLIGMDIGASGGLHPLWKPYGNFMEVDAFEPNREACAVAEANSDAFIKWHPIALGGTTGKQRFFVLNAPSGSSFYPPNDDVQQFFNDSHYRGIREVVEVDTTTVSDFVRTFNRPHPNLLKLDTQGSELDILRSLDEDNWGEVLAIEVEVEFLELYSGQPLFQDVDSFVKGRGFQLFDLRTAREYCSAFDTTGYYMKKLFNFAVGRNDLSARLYAGDALYIQDFMAHPPTTKERLLQLVATLLIYSYFDYAVHLCELGEQLRLLNRSERSRLVNEIAEAAPKPKLWERADEKGDRARRLMALHRLNDTTFQAFWMVRNWPNQ